MKINATVAITYDMLVPWQKRLLNFIIDYLIVLGLFFILGIVAALLTYVGVFGLYNWITTVDGIEDRVATTFVYLLYLCTFEALTQRSVGKYITGTMVVAEDGFKPDFGAFFKRSLCRLIPFDAFSFFGENARGWHDSIPGVYVVDTKKYKAALALKNSFEEIGSEPIL